MSEITPEQFAVAMGFLEGVEEWCEARVPEALRPPDAWEPSLKQHRADALRATWDCRGDPLLRAAALVAAARWVLEKEVARTLEETP